MIKALFFDIDGTLVSFRTHEVPQSTVEALAEAKRRGVKVFIATGRPMAFINNLGAIEHLVDGYMTTNGALCTIGQKQVGLSPLCHDDVQTLLSYVQTHRAPCVVMGVKGIAAMNATAESDHVMFDVLNIRYDLVALPLQDVLAHEVLQITPFIDDEQEATLVPQLRCCVSARWYPAFTDITSLQADKGSGLATMAAALGVDISETMAFGDGGNDKTILRRAGIGVAMGNALDDVKAAADYVTASVDDDGVARALSHFGVID